MATCAVGPEICNNHCDDDRNGYTDGDDPACSTQMLVTLAINPSMTAPSLDRLILEPQPALAILDGNPVQAGGMAAYNRAFSDSAYIAFEGGTKVLRRVLLDGGIVDNLPGFNMRDVCVFNGELIVVEPFLVVEAGGRLRRFMADAQTEITPPVKVTGHLSACASDGERLYVARYQGLVSPSEIVVFTKSANGPQPTSLVYPIPSLACCDRLIDFAYVKKGGVFIGLFANGGGGGTPDSSLDSELMAPFDFDGGMGALIDAGRWHGLGEFLP
jgi:hypothetical protein